MKTRPTAVKNPLLRGVVIASFAFALAACGGGGSDDPVDPEENPIEEPPTVIGENIGDGAINGDINGDNIVDTEDDINGDGFIDQADVDEFNALQEPPEPIGDGLDCNEFDCLSEDAIWTNNAWVSVSKNSISTYAKGIQRIMYCLNYAPDGATLDNGVTLDNYDDGVYGMRTEESVKLYQSDEGIADDGIVGPDTWFQLQEEIGAIPGSSDGVYVYYEILSSLEECDGPAFAQEEADPKRWLLTSEVGSSNLIPFWICDSEDLNAICPP